jgi:H+/Cl- antiporter ClcA
VSNVPIIIAGSGGGYFKQGEYVLASGENKPLLSAAAAAAGAGTGFGTPMAAVKA